MTIAVDFDGTIVEHRYPEIGEEIPFATDTLKQLIADRHKLILWSVREGKLLDEAVEWCRERGVEFWAVNKDYPDRNIGGLPEWGLIYQMICSGKSYRRVLKESMLTDLNQELPKKKHWWSRK